MMSGGQGIKKNTTDVNVDTNVDTNVILNQERQPAKASAKNKRKEVTDASEANEFNVNVDPLSIGMFCYCL